MGCCSSKRDQNGGVSSDSDEKKSDDQGSPRVENDSAPIVTMKSVAPSSVTETSVDNLSSIADVPQERRDSTSSVLVPFGDWICHAGYAMAFLTFTFGTLLTIYIWKYDSIEESWQTWLSWTFGVSFFVVLLVICIPNLNTCCQQLSEDRTCCSKIGTIARSFVCCRRNKKNNKKSTTTIESGIGETGEESGTVGSEAGAETGETGAEAETGESGAGTGTDEIQVLDTENENEDSVVCCCFGKKSKKQKVKNDNNVI